VTFLNTRGMSTVSIYERFEDLPEIYRTMFGNALAATDFFLTLPWFRHLADTTLDHRHILRIYGVESCGQPCAVLPMCYEVPQYRFVGTRRLTALTNYYTPSFAPVIAQAATQVEQMLTVLIRFISLESSQWDTVDLHPLDVDSAVFSHFLAAFRAAGMPVQRYFCFGNWYLDVNGRSYQAYFDSLPSRLRNTLTRRSRHMEKSNRLRIDIFSVGSDLEKCIGAYEEIYRSSWKKPEAFPSFIPGLIQLCSERGWLRMGIAYVDGQPAAAQIWIVHHGVASIYKLAYDERFAKLSVGSILTSRLMQHVIDVDCVREVDYLTGDDAYKSDWMPNRRERWGVVAFNLRTLRGKMSAIKHLGGAYVKGLFRGHNLS
jgi:hypothetical protein